MMKSLFRVAGKCAGAVVETGKVTRNGIGRIAGSVLKRVRPGGRGKEEPLSEADFLVAPGKEAEGEEEFFDPDSVKDDESALEDRTERVEGETNDRPEEEGLFLRETIDSAREEIRRLREKVDRLTEERDFLLEMNSLDRGPAPGVEAESKEGKSGMEGTGSLPRSESDSDEKPGGMESSGISLEALKDEVRESPFERSIDRVMVLNALSTFEEGQDEEARIRAASGLGGICGSPASSRVLSWQFFRDQSAKVREECVHSIYRQGQERGFDAVKAGLSDSSVSVRLASVRAVYGMMGREGAELLSAMLKDENEDVRRRAATCLGWIGHASLAEDLVPLLSDPSPSVRRACLEAMGNLRSLDSLSSIVELLGDEEISVRKQACNSLQIITGVSMPLPLGGGDEEEVVGLLVARWKDWWNSREEEI